MSEPSDDTLEHYIIVTGDPEIVLRLSVTKGQHPRLKDFMSVMLGSDWQVLPAEKTATWNPLQQQWQPMTQDVAINMKTCVLVRRWNSVGNGDDVPDTLPSWLTDEQ